MKLISYNSHIKKLPLIGKHIVGTFDQQSIIVYQGFNKSIAQFALKNGFFGGPFNYDRLSWIKPNFMWMMYRSEWAEMEEYILSIRLKRDAFEAILAKAVHTTYKSNHYNSGKEWKNALKKSEVRVQWDPDHDPYGKRLARKAIQLGLSGETLKKYGKEWIIEIEDITPFVKKEKHNRSNFDLLKVPEEKIFIPKNISTCQYLEID